MSKTEFEKIELDVPKGLLGVLDEYAKRRGLKGGRDEMLKGLLLGFAESCARDLDDQDKGKSLPSRQNWSLLTVWLPPEAIGIIKRSAVELKTDVLTLVNQCLREWTEAQALWHETLDAKGPPPTPQSNEPTKH